jgi:hypothetical protein
VQVVLQPRSVSCHCSGGHIVHWVTLQHAAAVNRESDFFRELKVLRNVVENLSNFLDFVFKYFFKTYVHKFKERKLDKGCTFLD